MIRIGGDLAGSLVAKADTVASFRVALVVDVRVHVTSTTPSTQCCGGLLQAAASSFGIQHLLPHLTLHPLSTFRDNRPCITECYEALLRPPATAEQPLDNSGQPLPSWHLVALGCDYLRGADVPASAWVPRPPPGPAYGPYAFAVVAGGMFFQMAFSHRGPTFGDALHHAAARWEMSALLPHVTAHRVSLPLKYALTVAQCSSALCSPDAREPVDEAALLTDTEKVPRDVWYLLLVDGDFIKEKGVAVPPSWNPLHAAITAAIAARSKRAGSAACLCSTAAVSSPRGSPVSSAAPAIARVAVARSHPPTPRTSLVSLLCGLMPRFAPGRVGASRVAAAASDRRAVAAASLSPACAEDDSELQPLRPRSKSE